MERRSSSRKTTPIDTDSTHYRRSKTCLWKRPVTAWIRKTKTTKTQKEAVHDRPDAFDARDAGVVRLRRAQRSPFEALLGLGGYLPALLRRAVRIRHLHRAGGSAVHP